MVEPQTPKNFTLLIIFDLVLVVSMWILSFCKVWESLKLWSLDNKDIEQSED